MGDELTIEDYTRDYNRLKDNYDKIRNLCVETSRNLNKLQHKYDDLSERYNRLSDLVFRFADAVTENAIQLKQIFDKEIEE